MHTSTFWKFVLCLMLFVGSSAFGQSARFGYLLYKGPTSLDIWPGELTGSNASKYSKVDFYVNTKKVATLQSNQVYPEVVTVRGLPYNGNPISITVRCTKSGGGVEDGTLINTPGSGIVILGTDFYGVLTRKDTINIKCSFFDSLYIVGGGPSLVEGTRLPNKWYLTENLPVSVQGGDLFFMPGADVTYDFTGSQVIAGLSVMASPDIALYPHGKFTGVGGKLKEVNTRVWGQFGPVSNMFFEGSDMHVFSNTVAELTNCTLDWLELRGDFSDFVHDHNGWVAKKNTVLNDCHLSFCSLAEENTIKRNAQCYATVANKNIVQEGGSLILWPKDVPTSARHNTFKSPSGLHSGGDLRLSNKSVVEFNMFEPSTITGISKLSGSFDPNDVGEVHVNWNHFDRLGSDAATMSNLDCDFIDATKNYWGRCEGPENGDIIGKINYEPFLRVPYPQVSYFVQVGYNKNKIIANNEDEVIFDVRFYNIMTGADSAGATVNYAIVVSGDTIADGAIVTDANGRGILSIKLDEQYAGQNSLQAYFNTLQCNEFAYIIQILKQEGPDLEMYDPTVVQVQGAEPEIIAGKPFFVYATITTTEPVPDPFKVRVRINNKDYETFYRVHEDYRDVNFAFETPLDELTFPSGSPLSTTIIWRIDDLSITPGEHDVQINIDPREPGLEKGRIIEGSETNNESIRPINFRESAWGYNGSRNAKVFIQPLDDQRPNHSTIMSGWADSAKSFMERAWPMKQGQIELTKAAAQDYKRIMPDSLEQESWQLYLQKAYKQMRIANPGFDRYVFAVDREWFGNRLKRSMFTHDESQTLAWSGIYELATVSMDHYKHLAHTLGHTYHLRRGDYVVSTDDINAEQYYNYFIGKEIENGYDFENNRQIHMGLINKVARTMKARCFMGASILVEGSLPYVIWISEPDYQGLFANWAITDGSPAPATNTVERARFIEGYVDSTTKAFSFGPSPILLNATPSQQVEEKWAKYRCLVLDENGTELARHLYAPSFQALGLDEGSGSIIENPRMLREYFAFVVPWPNGAKKFVVQTIAGTPVTEEVESLNAPTANLDFPASGSKLPIESSDTTVTMTWSGADVDGDTPLYYTVEVSTDGGTTWQIIVYESTDISKAVKLLKDKNYQVRITVSDIFHSTQQSFVFSTTASAGDVFAAHEFTLSQNYPNPFAQTTSLTFSLAKPGHVSLAVYDALGRQVAVLTNEYLAPGSYTRTFDASSLPEGAYTVAMRAGTSTKTVKMILAK